MKKRDSREDGRVEGYLFSLNDVGSKYETMHAQIPCVNLVSVLPNFYPPRKLFGPQIPKLKFLVCDVTFVQYQFKNPLTHSYHDPTIFSAKRSSYKAPALLSS